MPVALVIKLAAALLANPTFDRLVVLALWNKARKTKPELDDAVVQLVAAKLGVTLPDAPSRRSGG